MKTTDLKATLSNLEQEMYDIKDTWRLKINFITLSAVRVKVKVAKKSVCLSACLPVISFVVNQIRNQVRLVITFNVIMNFQLSPLSNTASRSAALDRNSKSR